MLVDRKWFAELWRYRELLYFLAWRDIKVRYKQAALGAAWAILQPLTTMIVFTIVFARIAGASREDAPYPLFAYCALVLWTYVSSVVGQAALSLVSNSNLITKVYFPRLALPASSAVSGLLDLGIGLSFLLVLMAYYQTGPSWTLLWLPAFFCGLLLMTVGISLLLAALNVRYRDIKHAVPFLLQLWFFVTPIIYPLSMVPEQFRLLMALNPLTGIVAGFQASVLQGQPIDPAVSVISLSMSVVVFLTGLTYFRRAERAFADTI
jgi:lipopolysaccharide transport system permease protein